MNSTFELAPARRGIDWQLAVAFSLVPAIVLFSTLYGFGNGLGLSSIAALAAFVVSGVMSLAAARPRTGWVRLQDDQIVVEYGRVSLRIPVAEIDLDMPSVSKDPGVVSIDVVTDPQRVLALQLRNGATLRMSLMDPEAFVAAVRAAQAEAVAV